MRRRHGTGQNWAPWHVVRGGVSFSEKATNHTRPESTLRVGFMIVIVMPLLSRSKSARTIVLVAVLVQSKVELVLSR